MTSLDQCRYHAEKLLGSADVHTDGLRTTDLMIHDNRVFARAIAHGTLGFGESCMDSDWDAVDLPGVLNRLLSLWLDDPLHTLRSSWLRLRPRLLDLQH